MNYLQTAPGEDPIIVEGFFPVSPSVMFKAWTDPDRVMKWFGRAPNTLVSAHIELKQGGEWRFCVASDDEHTSVLQGEYQEIVEDEKLAFSWRHVVTQANGESEETMTSNVEVTFSSKGNGTWVHLIHTGIAVEDARKGVGGGWNNSFGHILQVLGG